MDASRFPYCVFHFEKIEKKNRRKNEHFFEKIEVLRQKSEKIGKNRQKKIGKNQSAPAIWRKKIFLTAQNKKTFDLAQKNF